MRPKHKQKRAPRITRNDKLGMRLCEHISAGFTDAQACAREGVSYQFFWEWKRDDKAFASVANEARERRTDLLADGFLAIADDSTITTDERRVMLDARKWLMGKLSPRKYGDKMGIEHTGDTGLRVVINRLT